MSLGRLILVCFYASKKTFRFCLHLKAISTCYLNFMLYALGISLKTVLCLTFFAVVLKDFIWLCCIAENSVSILFQVSLQIGAFQWSYVCSKVWVWLMLSLVQTMFARDPWRSCSRVLSLKLMYEEETLVIRSRYSLVVNGFAHLLSVWDAAITESLCLEETFKMIKSYCQMSTLHSNGLTVLHLLLIFTGSYEKIT